MRIKATIKVSKSQNIIRRFLSENSFTHYLFLYFQTVNSPPVPHRDITGANTSYRPYNEEYTPIQRHVDRPLQPEVDIDRSKKDKKWSIGKLFRRKKKEDESGSSTQSEDGANNRSPSKRKSKKKKRGPPVNNFDHIVIKDTRRAQSLANPNIRDLNDDGVLSDPSAGFLNYKANSQEIYAPKESIQIKDVTSRSGKGILETPSRKKRKSRLKARVEALRNSMKGESSSEDESLKSSSNSSSMIRFRSDDSLMRSRDSSLNKRSRSARNERYIKRLSRDEENQLNKEAELLQQGYTKAEVEMLTRTPTSQSSGYGTCKRETTNNIVSDQLTVNETNRRPMKSESISSFPSTQSYPSSINFNAKVNNERINYAIQYPSNIVNRGSSHNTNKREGSVSSQYENPENIICVKFPLGNVTNIKKEEKSPPVPPPRDMHRKVVTPVSMYYENAGVTADKLSNTQNVQYGVPNNDFERIMRRSQERFVNYGMNGLRRPISTSEDHIAMQDNEYIQNYMIKNDQPRRPASVSAEPKHYGHFINNTPWRKTIDQNNLIKPEPVQLKQDYLYYADESPRSRRPISIKTSQNGYQNQYLSDSQVSSDISNKAYIRPRNASEFWKKIDDAERQRRQQNIFAHSRSKSEFHGPTHTNRLFTESKNTIWNTSQDQGKESVDNSNKIKAIDTIDGAKVWKATTEYKRSSTIEPKSNTSPTKTHSRHKSDTYVSTSNLASDEERSSERRKSTNLDDALNELEAIYNSLGLGDEDLLDRAERREMMTPKFNDQLNDWNGNDDIQLRSQPSTPIRRLSRRSTLPDKLQDDMAFRRMNSFGNKDVPNLKEAQAQISYMLASPVYVPYASDDDRHSERNEPDVVYDDVVYRNIKQTNNRLKTIDPQPPFGIPVGPISPAPPSDYLHATPENKGRSRFIPKRSPDIVADDLAYRSLRKDNRHSSLLNGEHNGYVNNNSYTDYPFMKDSPANIKKKRAVRSLSANIFSMIQKEIDDALNISKTSNLQKTHSNSDVMKRLRDTFEKNDNHKDYYPRNKVKQRHHTVHLFANTTHTPSHHFAKDDSFIHNDDICIAKPQSCDKSKSSSPSNRSPKACKRSSKDEFQQVLSMLAQEAMDTSNKLGVALAELDKNRNKSEVSDIQNRISDSRMNFMNELTRKSNENAVSNYDEAQSNKVVQNNNSSNKSVDICEDDSKGKKTEDSLLKISDQLHKVEDQLKYSFEKELKSIEDERRKGDDHDIDASKESPKIKEVTVLLDQNNATPSTVPLPYTIKNESEGVTLVNTIESEITPMRYNPLNPFLNTDDTLKELNEIRAFKELKDGISDLIAGITEVNEKFFVSKSPKKEQCFQSTEPTLQGVTEKLNKLTQNNTSTDVTNRTSASLSVYEDDLENKKDTADSTEYNSSEELATIFKIDNIAKPSQSNNVIQNDNESKERNDLNSPKLVKTMTQHLRRLSVDESTSQNNSLPTNVVPWRTKRQNSNSQNDKKGTWSLIMHGVQISL